MALGGVLLVEQDANPAEGDLRDVDHRDQMGVFDRDAVDDLIDLAAQDDDIFAHAFVGFVRRGGVENGAGVRGGRGDPFSPARGKVERCAVGLRQPQLRRAFGPMRGLQRDDGFGQRVAAEDPGRFQIVHVPTFQKSVRISAGRTPRRSSFHALMLARHTIV